jgi:two-component sensor histidine kinase
VSRTRLDNVTIPDDFEDAFKVAEATVEEYFNQQERHPEKGTIEVEDERYVLVRAESISVDFFQTLKTLYPTVDADVRQSLGHKLLFELAFNLGQSDAQHFHETMDVENPIQRLSTGPVHFAHSGWARVNILEDSNPTPNKDYLLHYTHPNSFEADSWIGSDEDADEPICYMNAGYSSGWCTESFGINLISVEVQCRATGDDKCEFLMGHSDRIQELIEDYDNNSGETTQRRIPDLPDFVKTRKLARTVRQQEERINALARLHEENPNPVLRFAPDGELLYRNEGTEKHWDSLDLETGEPLGDPFDKWVRTAWERQETMKHELSLGDHWYQLDLVPVQDLNYINLYAVEITEQKKAERAIEQSLEEKQLIIKELHHRIKNNLQMASSLLDLQSSTLENTSAKNALKQSKNRLRTMAMIHDKLSRSEEGENVRLDEYLSSIVRDIVSMYRNDEEVNIEFKLMASTVPSEIAVPCGLIVNELVTNALEHGLSDTTDETLRFELDCDNDQHRLVVADNGVLADQNFTLNDPDGLGLNIVLSMVEDQLGGELTLNTGEWTTFEVQFKT